MYHCTIFRYNYCNNIWDKIKTESILYNKYDKLLSMYKTTTSNFYRYDVFHTGVFKKTVYDYSSLLLDTL